MLKLDAAIKDGENAISFDFIKDMTLSIENSGVSYQRRLCDNGLLPKIFALMSKVKTLNIQLLLIKAIRFLCENFESARMDAMVDLTVIISIFKSILSVITF